MVCSRSRSRKTTIGIEWFRPMNPEKIQPMYPAPFPPPLPYLQCLNRRTNYWHPTLWDRPSFFPPDNPSTSSGGGYVEQPRSFLLLSWSKATEYCDSPFVVHHKRNSIDLCIPLICKGFRVLTDSPESREDLNSEGNRTAIGTILLMPGKKKKTHTFLMCHENASQRSILSIGYSLQFFSWFHQSQRYLSTMRVGSKGSTFRSSSIYL